MTFPRGTRPVWHDYIGQAGTAARAALAAIEAEGFAVVPKEPTMAMIDAGESTLEENTESDYSSNAEGERFPYEYFRSGHMRAVFLSMIAAAAPKP